MRRRNRLIITLAALAVAAAVLPGTAVRAATGTTRPKFGTPVAVDNYRPGFEPDVAVDTSQSGQGLTYTSFPFGFSTTQSFIYRSDDGRKSFRLTEGNALGKPTTCAGGGDTEFQADPVSGKLYFVDLQGLTNFSASASSDHGATWDTACNAVNGVGVDRQWVGVDSNGGASAVGDGANDGRLYLDYDNVLQNSDPDFVGNQLVMNESLDGVHYGAQCQAAGVPCPAPPAVISVDEDIPGNIVVDNVSGSAYQHTVYAVHTSNAGDAVIVSSCRGKAGDTTAAQVAQDCTDPTQVAPGDPARVNVNWHDAHARVPGSYSTGSLFAAIAIDRAGRLYVVWSEYPVNSSGDPVGPGVVKMSVSKDGSKTWSAPVNVSPPTLGNNVMPWITAGDPGRVDIAWYGAKDATNASGVYGPDTLDAGIWDVYLAQSLDALSAYPSFTVVKVTDHPAKFGNISTQGLGGSPDRSLGDFMQVTTGLKGEAVISYVDDTSADRNPDFCFGCGETPPEAAGPPMIAVQNGGPSLYKSVGTVKGAAGAVGSVKDSAQDASYASAGSSTPAPAALDVTGASIKQADATHVVVALSTADPDLAQHLAFPGTLGGPVGEWIVRWAAPSYTAPGDGNIFYVGMESVNGGTPEFYTGTTGAITSTHANYFTYPKTMAVPGTISANSITWTVPLSAIGSPAVGDGLFSVTGFSATQLTPSQATVLSPPNGGTFGDEDVPNVLDLTPPFTYRVGSTKTAAGSVPWLVALALLGTAATIRRRLASKAGPQD